MEKWEGDTMGHPEKGKKGDGKGREGELGPWVHNSNFA